MSKHKEYRTSKPDRESAAATLSVPPSSKSILSTTKPPFHTNHMAVSPWKRRFGYGLTRNGNAPVARPAMALRSGWKPKQN